jgi:hypothetical protein
MNQQEAATYLGISVRSLQRYVQAERLRVRYESGKTRPVPIYDDQAIEALKAKLAYRPVFPQSQGKSVSERKQPFGFRLAPQEREDLVRNAQQYGMKPSEYARLLVQSGLEDGLQNQISTLQKEIMLLREQVATLENALRQLQADFPATVEVLLEFGGMEPKAAKHWIATNLLRKG